ncbi:MAG TPA: hypothetical protein VFK32_03585 [Tepidiformaceae bacterium]|nr:hypothetical protein [Tepidiformaceae bacterium]
MTAIYCRRVLEMVHELHHLGYQRIRACPAIAPTGLAWRCAITPAQNTLRIHGARLYDWNSLTAHYSSGMGDRYFDWDDGPGKGPKALARLFVERYPDIVRAGEGSDWAYVGWFVEMLNRTTARSLPYAMSDWDDPDDRVPTTDEGTALPLPPAGEAEAR